MRNEFTRIWSDKIHRIYNDDAGSRLGTYLSINPDLSKPVYGHILEFRRKCISRYRTGSHNLKIETGRQNPRIAREERLCLCFTSIQTIKHCLLECPLLNETRELYNITDIQNGILNVEYLKEMERILGVK